MTNTVVPRLLKTALWLAAWGVWLWLGVGLYRELPRNVREVSALPVDIHRNSVMGFVGDTTRVAICDWGHVREQRPVVFRIFDARNGEEVAETAGVLSDALLWSSLAVRHGVAIFNKDRDDRSGEQDVWTVELQTGRWRQLWAHRADKIAVHPVKPWIVIVEERRPGAGCCVVVMDFESGRKLFEHALEKGRRVHPLITWIGDSDSLLLATAPESSARGLRRQREVELWRIGDHCERLRVIEGSVLGAHNDVSPSGRVVTVASMDRYEAFRVFDLFRGERVFSHDLPPGVSPPKTSPRTAAISTSGRSVLAGNPLALWDVDAGVPRWRPSDFEEVAAAVANAAVFEESWWKFLGTPATKKLLTWARRSLEDASLIVRTWERVHSEPHMMSKDGTLTVDFQGRVFESPPRVDWLLLAVCQTILASPLILVWYLLRRRHQRRAKRMAGASP